MSISSRGAVDEDSKAQSGARAIPGPRPLPVIGTAYSIDPNRLVQSDIELAKKYGEIFVQRFPGRAPVIFVSSQRLVAELCDESRFDKQVHPAIENVRAFAGNGLFTADTIDPEWQKAHRVLMPAFSPLALNEMYEGMSDIAEQLILKWARERDDTEISVTDDFTRLTLDTIALCSFKYRFNSFYREGMHEFVDAMVQGLEESSRQAHKPEAVKKAMRGSRQRLEDSVQTMHRIVDSLIAERRRSESAADPGWKPDIMDLMMTAVDSETGERLSDENVRYQLVSFLIAGHETTSGLLSFALYELLNNRDVMRKAQDYVDEKLQGRFPTLDDLNSMGYINQILRETLRLHPTAPAFGVTPFEPTTIGDDEHGPGYAVNPGDSILVLLPLMHQDPTIWDSPERFDPDRFEFKRFNELPPHSWKPFGNGQRSCIGRGFALQEAQLVLTLVLQHFNLTLADPDYKLHIKETLTIKPADFRVLAKPRTNAAEVGTLRTQTDDSNAVGPQTTEETEESCIAKHDTAIQILHGSNADTARSFAARLFEEAKRKGFTPTLSSLDNAVAGLITDGPVLVVTSSYEGLPPDNARRFVEWLENEDQDLSGVKYAVFGCGNSEWGATFQRIPTLIDTELENSGATRLIGRGIGDVKVDFESAFDEWDVLLWQAVGREYNLDLDSDSERTPLPVVSLIDDSSFRSGTITEVTRLDAGGDSGDIRGKYHVEIEFPAGMSYATGDYLDVLPLNSQRNVQRALDLVGMDFYQEVVIGEGDDRVGPVFAGEFIQSKLDLNAPISRRALSLLKERAAMCPPDLQRINALETDDAFEQQVVAKRTSFLDFVEQLHAVPVDMPLLAGAVTPLVAREYSISSTPLELPDRVTLTVSEVAAPAWSGSGEYSGLASSFLASRGVGDLIPVQVRPGRDFFRPPENPETQMVLIGGGSGIAPLRAFLHEAERRGGAVKPHHLYYGCHGPESDLLYSTTWQDMESCGLVETHFAFSRHVRAAEAGTSISKSGEIRYVQDLLLEDPKTVLELLESGAVFYVCGGASTVARGVREAMREILAQHMGSAESAAEELQKLETSGRFAVESFT